MALLKVAIVLASMYICAGGVKPGQQECLIDEKKGRDDPNNIYPCLTGTKCCMEAGEPSCCTNKDTSESIMEQVKLWGSLLGFIFGLCIFACYCNKEIQFCDDADERTLGERCCPCSNSGKGRERLYADTKPNKIYSPDDLKDGKPAKTLSESIPAIASTSGAVPPAATSVADKLAAKRVAETLAGPSTSAHI